MCLECDWVMETLHLSENSSIDNLIAKHVVMNLGPRWKRVRAAKTWNRPHPLWILPLFSDSFLHG